MALTTIPSELSSVSGIADSSDATAITISSQENVGIGVTPKTWHSDWEALQIGERAAFFSQASTTTGIGENVYYDSGWKAIAAAAGSLYQLDSGNHHFYTMASVSAGAAASPNEKFTIKNDGKVGIGETSPTRVFVVKRSDSAGTVAEFENTGTSSYIQFTCNSQADNAAGYVGYNSDKDLTLWTNDVQRVTIDVNGYMGIGETSPDNKLHITGANWNNAHIKIERTDVGGSNDAGLVFKSAAGANDAYGLGGIWFQNALDSNAYALIRARTDDSSGTSGRLDFITSTGVVGNGTDARMTIDSNGYVGIGTTNPALKLHVVSTGSATYSGSSAGSNIGLHLANLESGAAGRTIGIGFSSESNAEVYLNCVTSSNNNGGDFVIASRNGGTRAEKLRIEAGGAVLPGGDATQNLGSASKRWDNLYVNDMHFSNEGSDGNDVDGTTGDWTLQEGEEHLYIINNKSGKKFKFSLEEVE